MLVIKLEYHFLHLVLCKRSGFLQTEQLYGLFVPWLLLEVISVGMLGCNVDCSASVEQTKLIHLTGRKFACSIQRCMMYIHWRPARSAVCYICAYARIPRALVPQSIVAFWWRFSHRFSSVSVSPERGDSLKAVSSPLSLPFFPLWDGCLFFLLLRGPAHGWVAWICQPWEGSPSRRWKSSYMCWYKRP